LEEEEEEKAKKKMRLLHPPLPKDRLGRIKKGVRVQDYRPQAPRNTTQDILEKGWSTSFLTKFQATTSSSPDLGSFLPAIDDFGSMVPLKTVVAETLKREKEGHLHRNGMGAGEERKREVGKSENFSDLATLSIEEIKSLFRQKQERIEELIRENNQLREQLSVVRSNVPTTTTTTSTSAATAIEETTTTTAPTTTEATTTKTVTAAIPLETVLPSLQENHCVP